MVIATPVIDIGHILTWYANNEKGDNLSIKIPDSTCLISGVCATTAMAAILSEMIRSSWASSTLSSIYVPFLGFALISVLNGLVPHY
ncbi:hypothetical protein MKX01_013641 [Papaver californicum]|nr:hypothetical protein MKX01_013641 [Papaver californicum]